MDSKEYQIKLIELLRGKRNILLVLKNELHSNHILKEYKNAETITTKELFENRIQNLEPSKIFIIFVDQQYEDGLESQLNQHYFKADQDYIFIKHKPIIIENSDFSKTPYIDHYGNIIKANLINAKITLCGYCSNILITGTYLKYNLKVYDDATVFIKDSVLMGSDIKVSPLGKIVIDSGYLEEKNKISVYYNSTLKMNKKIHILKNSVFTVRGIITIGEECLISNECNITSGFGNVFYYKKTKEPIRKTNKILIGNRVFIGNRCTLLNGTEIGDESIILDQSVVVSKFSNNCLIAGNIAQLKLEGVCWKEK